MSDRPATRVLSFGESAILVEQPDQASTLALHRALERVRTAGVTDLVPAARTVLVRFDRRVLGPAAARSLVDAALALATEPDERMPVAPPARVVIEVDYSGADLDAVAEMLATDRAGLVAAHSGRDWLVAFGGFAPGFAYLVAGEADEHGEADDPASPLRVWPSIPRLAVPRTSVPAGSVALAGEFSGVYPRASPGGWRLIGSTDAELWNLDRDEPALLRPGATVRFVAR